MITIAFLLVNWAFYLHLSWWWVILTIIVDLWIVFGDDGGYDFGDIDSISFD